jgi:hypothetical protein
MSKKKNTQNQQVISPLQYIRTKARNLPIAECYINDDWEKAGLANIIVARKHKSGNYTIGIYLVDIFCLGVKDTTYKFNIPRENLDEKLELFFTNRVVSYDIAHNIIYGAVAYAEDLGIRPHKDFELTKYILEEDTDEIPLIEYEFGKDGKPFLMASNNLELNKYRSILEKTTNGDFSFSMVDFEDDFEDEEYEEYEEEYKKYGDEYNEDLLLEKVQSNFPDLFDNLTKEKMHENLKKAKEKMEKRKLLPHTEYNYQYPEYPKELKLTHEELNCLFLVENNARLQEETIGQILSLPRESLIEDLKHCILYTIGQFNTNGQLIEDDVYGTLAHCLLLLGELRAEESLDTVLEIMRQNEEFSEFYFGDYADQFLVLTLYYIAENKLDAILSYAKEPGLATVNKCHIFPMLALVAIYQPERRAEVIEWFCNILNFYYEKRADTSYYDANLVALMMDDLIDIQASELLPEIKKLFDTGLVDEFCAGDFKAVKKEMSGLDFYDLNQYKLLDIYERYDDWMKIC